jgi:beta-glucosidase
LKVAMLPPVMGEDAVRLEPEVLRRQVTEQFGRGAVIVPQEKRVMLHSRRSTPVALCMASLLLSLVASAHGQSGAPREPYLDRSLAVEQRVVDLVGRMTLAEKIAQMQNAAPAIPRLHIAEYDWWNEGLHGVARSGYATVFPQAIGLAATFDRDLVHRVADVISTEARAKYNQAQRENNHSIYFGLTFWSPNINIVRDPRWGRGQETYGEDPFLTGQIGSAFVTGLQGPDPQHPKVIATAKHFAVHSGPESARHSFNAVISPHDLEDTYLPAFRRLVVDAHVGSVMCAYNAVDGDPACASTMLLQQKLKRDWHFTGYTVSDCAAISDVAVGHHFAPDMAHAAAASVKAGTDLSCGKEYAALADAVRQGLLTEGDIDAAVGRLFAARFRLGMFDLGAPSAFDRIPYAEDDSPAHAALALQTARASIVLLKNDAATLPLKPAVHTIAVIGPNAAALPALEGNYNAVPSHPMTPLAALEQRMPGHVVYSQGSPYVEGLPVPVPATVFDSATQRGLHAEYFNNLNFKGAPQLVRTDSAIDFDWNAAPPVAGLSSKTFSVRWTGLMAAPATGPITFDFSIAHCSTCNDAESVRVWLDGEPVYDFTHAASHGRRSALNTFTIVFHDTKPHPIRIEYTHDAPYFGAGLSFRWLPPVDALRTQAVDAAAKADVIVAFLGLSPEIEGEQMPISVKGFEGGDRSSIELPDAQLHLVEALATTGKPLILVLMNGSALALQGAAQRAPAILEAWYPGQAGGTAIAQTLFGENNPSGRLPVTFYASTEQLPAFDSYSMQDRTYRYFHGEPLYPFGFGLSYTTFAYSHAKLSATQLRAGDALDVSVQLTNTGARAGEQIVQLYLVPESGPSAPLRQLVGFERRHLEPGASTTVRATIQPRELSLVDAKGRRSVQPGHYKLYLGDGQRMTSSDLLLPFEIQGSAPIQP